MAYYLIFHIKFLDSVSFLGERYTLGFRQQIVPVLENVIHYTENNNKVHIIVSPLSCSVIRLHLFC